MITINHTSQPKPHPVILSSSPNHEVGVLGQVFTPQCVVTAMRALRQNKGRVLEPSCGDGAFCQGIDNLVAIEIDATHAPVGSIVMDFFVYPDTEQFHTAIGNPPYVRNRDILPATRQLLKSSLLDGRANLYLYFIEKTVRHLLPGAELIFITPRDFLKSTASVRLNQWLVEQGTITHAIELGDSAVFADATPNCLIWRFEKGNFQRVTQYAEIGNRDDLDKALANPEWEQRTFAEHAGHLSFPKGLHSLLLRDIAQVKVGAASGATDLYADPVHGNREFVFSKTALTGRTRKMIWTETSDAPPDVLLAHKARLIARDIKPFNESNWWQWGRGYPQTDAPRVYVNTLTRNKRPFFLHECRHFDSSVLAIFPKNHATDLVALCRALNEMDWRELGFVCDGRFKFSQRSLKNSPLSEGFAKFR